MKITDLDGREITVTDLNKAVKKAALFKGFYHPNATPEQKKSDKERQLYWTDIYQKLLQLQLKNTKAIL